MPLWSGTVELLLPLLMSSYLSRCLCGSFQFDFHVNFVTKYIGLREPLLGMCVWVCVIYIYIYGELAIVPPSSVPPKPYQPTSGCTTGLAMIDSIVISFTVYLCIMHWDEKGKPCPKHGLFFPSFYGTIKEGQYSISSSLPIGLYTQQHSKDIACTLQIGHTPS